LCSTVGAFYARWRKGQALFRTLVRWDCLSFRSSCHPYVIEKEKRCASIGEFYSLVIRVKRGAKHPRSSSKRPLAATWLAVWMRQPMRGTGKERSNLRCCREERNVGPIGCGLELASKRYDMRSRRVSDVVQSWVCFTTKGL